MAKINIYGKYPCKANWTMLRREGEKIIARNCLTDDEFVLSAGQAKYLSCLNGNRDPRRIKGFSYDECREYYSLFETMGLIRKSGNLIVGATNYHALYIPNKKKSQSIIPKIFNFLMLCFCIPVFLFGLYRVILLDVMITFNHFLIGNLGGVICGVTLHELAHAMAALSYGGCWFEAGIMWGGLLPGAYVLVDDSNIKNILKRVQINLAGIEMNLLLSGILLMLISYSFHYSLLYEWKDAMFYAVIQNVVQAFLNLSFIEGLDGECAISLLLGKDSVVKNAKKNILCIFEKKLRKRFFRKRGINGMADICVSVVVLISQLLLPLLVLFGISILIGVISI